MSKYYANSATKSLSHKKYPYPIQRYWLLNGYPYHGFSLKIINMLP